MSELKPDLVAAADALYSDALQLPPEERLDFIRSRAAAEYEGDEHSTLSRLLWLRISGVTSSSDPRILVVPIHGIRTRGEWQEWLRRKLNAYQGVSVHPIGYDFLDAGRFWFPFLTRQPVIDRLKRELRAIRSDRPHDVLCIVAHSFGTYAVTEILQSEPDIAIDRLLLCGGIVREKFRWDLVVQRPDPIVNDCGLRDVYPVLAKAFSWGYGATGRFGFKTYHVTDRFHSVSHSGYFSDEVVDEYWVPFVLSGDKKSSPTDGDLGSWRVLAWFLSWFPLKTTLAAGIAFALGLATGLL